ncbi:MAG: efflux RND transporter periplasmic adaptor subunit [Thauera phenolivorans]|uniref:Efflux RND transporter periplasmic adaptor subunit n=1 Tax=Thauera phenolivorans TaxID=1792543 RepID=A0A7X7LVW2_9RHOO|nr:efflux RND transporter periplasmic adaptor subunit [Thauera phenolivorans]
MNSEAARVPRTGRRFSGPVLGALLALLTSGAFGAGWTARPLSELAVYPEFRAQATVVAREEASLAAEVSARIVAMPVREAEAVGRGEVLVRLDDAAYRIEVDRARAALALVDNRIRLAEAQLSQARSLEGRGFISRDGLRIKETELAVLRSERDAAAAALAAARLDLARTTLRAPYAGVVRERIANVGDLAVVGTPLLRLAASRDAELRARVPVSAIDSLRAAGEWTLVAGELRQAVTIRRVSTLVEAAGQVREVVLDSPAPLAPGLAGELRWRSARPHLPPAYVQEREGTLGTWVERDGEPHFIALPQAEAGRSVALDWPADARIIDEGRFGFALEASAATDR